MLTKDPGLLFTEQLLVETTAHWFLVCLGVLLFVVGVLAIIFENRFTHTPLRVHNAEEPEASRKFRGRTVCILIVGGLAIFVGLALIVWGVFLPTLNSKFERLLGISAVTLVMLLATIRPKEVGKFFGSWDPRGLTPDEFTTWTRVTGVVGLAFSCYLFISTLL